MVGRIVRSADFERVLRQPPCARSGHFAIHHLPAGPAMPELSTASAPERAQVVDQCARSIPCVGSVVPKRLARRAVTRNLVKRQIRAAAGAAALAPGWWVVRLRAPIERGRWPSAASAALRATLRAELERAFADAGRAR